MTTSGRVKGNKILVPTILGEFFGLAEQEPNVWKLVLGQSLMKQHHGRTHRHTEELERTDDVTALCLQHRLRWRRDKNR